MFNIEKVRQDFPILQRKVHGHPLIYFDNAATMQKPSSMIEVIDHYYRTMNANVHRGVHDLSVCATQAYESARETVQKFIAAKHSKEIVFTKGTTEAINLVAASYGRSQLKAGDEVLISTLEHHANIVPWQMICEQTGAKLRVIPINDEGDLLLDAYESLLNSRTKIVAITHISNAIGTINPIFDIIKKAHEVGAVVLVDGAQAVAHQSVNVFELDCDFYVFSGHKLIGPTGIGVLYGKASLLEKMPPYQTGGDMIREVTFEKTSFAGLPNRFEAGTPAIAQALGLAAAINYVSTLGLADIEKYEHTLLQYALQRLAALPYIQLIGTPKNRAPIISFLYHGAHAHDVGTILDREGIAIRNGHHCAMPLMNRLGVVATSRASFCFYNTIAEIDSFICALEKVREIFRV